MTRKVQFSTIVGDFIVDDSLNIDIDYMNVDFLAYNEYYELEPIKMTSTFPGRNFFSMLENSFLNICFKKRFFITLKAMAMCSKCS